MSIQVEKVTPIKTRITLLVDPAAVSAEREKTIKAVRREAQVPGFRPGKAPLDMIKRRFGTHIDDEIKRNLAGEKLAQAIEEHKVRLIGRPELEKEEFTADGALEVVAVMETWPDIELAEYKGLEIKREKVVVLPAAVDGRLEGLRRRQMTQVPVEGRDICETGDVVQIDYEGRKDGEPFRGGSHKDYHLELGSQTFIPGFEDGVVGMKIGETKELSLTFPEMHGRTDLSGKPVAFTVTLKAIMKHELPELDDDFAKDTGRAETLEGLKQMLHDDIVRAEEERTKRRARKELIAKLVELHPLEVPAKMIDRQLDYMIRNYKVELALAGMPLPKDSAVDQELRGKFEPEAKKEVQSYFLFQAIAEKEGLTVTDDDLEAKYHELAGAQGRRVEEVAAQYQKENYVEPLRDELLDQKVVDFLLAHANVTWEDPLPPAADAPEPHDHAHDHDHDHE
jgi:trigger factor